jgi:hypothetical protein
MIAAIYARKSTEQTGVADEQRSVARQVEHARQYARRKGWTVADEHVYIDDGMNCGLRPGDGSAASAPSSPSPRMAGMTSGAPETSTPAICCPASRGEAPAAGRWRS